MSPQVQREYDAALDSKHRFKVRGPSPFDHYHVTQYNDGKALLEPRVLARLDQLSKKTLRMLDRSVRNFAKGVVGEPVDLAELREFADPQE